MDTVKEFPDENPKPAARTITVGACVPPQMYDVGTKVDWLHQTLGGETKYDAFFLPQEWLGGHYLAQLAAKHGTQMPLHFPRPEIEATFGPIAKQYQVVLGVGACVQDGEGPDEKYGKRGAATEEYLYFETDGKLAGLHRKFALPAYDDIRSNGAGRLYPEFDYQRRVRPVDLGSVGLRVGTVFCWEVYSRTIIPAYSFNDVNLLVHPIKFAPRGWLKKSKLKKDQPGTLAQVPKQMQYVTLKDDEIAITGFDQDAKSQDWINRLKSVQLHEAICPIAVSCNTWDIGEKYSAITGHVDELMGTTVIHEIPSVEGSKGKVHAFKMVPTIYAEGINNAFSAGGYKEAVGNLDGYNEMREKATMSIKMRRLEAHLIGGTTKQDVAQKAAR